MKLVKATAQWAALLSAMTLLTGCVTPALWAKKLYWPAEEPHLAAGELANGEDVLVCYDVHFGNSPKTYRWAYWLFATSSTGTNAKPHFINSEEYRRLLPISVRSFSGTNTVPAKGYCVFTGTDSRMFHLYRNGVSLGTYSLPSYQGAPPATFWRIGLTPVAAATDAAIVCAAVLAMGAGGAAH